jgi:TIR domain
MLAAGGKPSYTGAPYDVFISYSHGDPRATGKSPLAVWTHRLIDELRQDIESTSTEFDQLALWDDREADPASNLTPMLKDHVASSALLLIVMSPRYLNSPWCKDELTWFAQELGRRSEDEGCALVVRALPTQEETWPAELKDGNGHSVLGFWFHPRPAKEGIRPFGWPDPRPSDREFFDALSRLSTIVMQRLRKIKQRAILKNSITRAYKRSGGRLKIYLHGRQVDIDSWHQTRDKLIERGFEVFPHTLECGTTQKKALRLIQELRRQRIAAYSNCDALLVLRPQPGSWINSELETVAFDELRELEACYHKHIPSAVLDLVNDGALQHARFNVARFSGDAEWLESFVWWLNEYTTSVTPIDGELSSEKMVSKDRTHVH